MVEGEERAVLSDAVSSAAVSSGAVSSDPVSLDGVAGQSDDVLLASSRRGQLYWILWLLNAVDLATTKAVLERGGSEQNPVMRPLVEGVWGAAAVKIAILVVIGVLIRRCPPRSRRPDIALVLVTGWYLAVVAWNLRVLAATF